MKIRNGFVSNSSSSSFVIRGIKMKDTAVAKLLGISADNEEDKETDENEESYGEFDDPHDELFEKIAEKFGYGGQALVIESAKDPFDSSEYKGDVIIGVNLAQLEDGAVIALPEPDDKKIIEKIEKKLGKKIVKKLQTFVQYVSSDNY